MRKWVANGQDLANKIRSEEIQENQEQPVATRRSVLLKATVS